MAKFLEKLKNKNFKELLNFKKTEQEIFENEQPEPLSKESARAELEKRIAEKLSRMSNTDIEELFELHKQQIADKKNEARSSISRNNTDNMEGQLSFVDVTPKTKVTAEPVVAQTKSSEIVLGQPIPVIEPSVMAKSSAVKAIEPIVTEPSNVTHVLGQPIPVIETPVMAKAVEAVVAVEPVAVEVTEPEVAEAVEPVIVETTVEPVVAEAIEPIVVETVEPIVAETVEPVAAEIVVPVITEPETVEPVVAQSEPNIESQVDEFFKGFDAETEETPEASTFKESFLVQFDRFASGAMLESASKKTSEACSKITTKLSDARSSASLRFAKFSESAKGLMRKRNESSESEEIRQEVKVDSKKNKITRLMLLKCKRSAKKSERRVSSSMAGFINKIDHGNEVLTEKTVDLAVKGNKQFCSACDWAERSKKALLVCLAVVLTCAIATVSILNYFTAYIYAYNGRPLGMVKHQEDVLRVLEIVNEQLSREYGATVNIDAERDITFERVVSTSVNREVDDMQEVFNRLTYMQDMSASAYALFIDGRRVAIIDTEDHVNDLLENFRDIQLSQNGNGSPSQYESISFAEEIDIRPVDTQLGRLDDAEEILERIQEGTVSERIHVVQRGETFSGIARQHGVTQAELESINPDVEPARLRIDQEIVLQHAVPLLTVQTVEVTTFSEVIPYETIYEDNPNIFRGEQSTRVAGVTGEREVTARITRNNGLEIARENLYEDVRVPASPAVVVRGTREPPPRQGTGRLISPIAGGYRVTSNFGMRNGRMHNGVDMAIRTGTPIRAADGGTVTFAGWRGSFGYLVIIDHGGGMQTFYAHCSRLFVRRGDRVFQGQHIANVGSTGRSTGPHLHFEVHINGRPVNPRHHAPI